MTACQILQRLVGDIDDPLPVRAQVPVSIWILEARLIARSVMLEGSLYSVRMIQR